MPAKGITKDEFRDVMRRFKAKAERLVAAALKSARGHRKAVLQQMLDGELGMGMLWSFDHAKAHAAHQLECFGIYGSDSAELPACSGDMHHTIEHIHGLLAQKFETWLSHHRDCTDSATMQAALTEIFYTHVTAESVSKSVRDLPGLWRAIKGAHGAYVDYKWR